MAELINLQHPRWSEFIKRLEGPEGCNFHEVVPGNKETLKWKCSGDNGDRFLIATQILKTMGNFDIESSLQYFEKSGGYCDCEIILNIDTPTWLSQSCTDGLRHIDRVKAEDLIDQFIVICLDASNNCSEHLAGKHMTLSLPISSCLKCGLSQRKVQRIRKELVRRLNLAEQVK